MPTGRIFPAKAEKSMKQSRLFIANGENVRAAISRPQNCCAPAGFPPAEGKCSEVRQRNPATKVKTLLFCCRILYFFFYKSSLLSLHWKGKPLKKPGLMRFFEFYPRQRTCNQPATNLQRSGRFCLELSSCKGQLSCFSVIFSKLLVRCREFVAGNVPFPPLLPAVSGKHPWI